MFTNYRKNLVAAFGFALALVPVAVSGKVAGHGPSSVVFTATGPAGFKFSGKSTELRASEKDGVIEISVPLSNLETGISLRDKHMREKYLEVDKYPLAVLRVDRANLKFPASDEVRGDATGQMTVRDRSKSVGINYSAKRDASGFVVVAKTTIDIRDFGIELPNYLGITVKPMIEIDVQFTLSDN